MDSVEAKTILNVLSELMNEDSDKEETPALNLYGKIRELISGALLAAAEKTVYQKKYDVINNANALADSIGLYLNCPELVNKYVLGFYKLNAKEMRAVTDYYLGASGGTSHSRPEILSNMVPTILVYGAAQDKIWALNLTGKQIPLSLESYALLNEKKQDVDLTGLLSFYCLHTRAVKENQAVIVLPPDANREVLFNALDTVVLPDVTPDTDTTVLLRCGNVKQIIAVKRGPRHSDELSVLARELGIRLTYAQAVQDALAAGDAAEMNTPTNNFCNRTWMESCLCGVLWYLAEQKEVLHERVAQINQDLVDNTEAAEQIKQLQKEVSQQIKRVDETAEEYYKAMSSILIRIEKLQQLCGTEEQINLHVVMADRLLELMAAEGAFFKYYNKSNANDHIRALYSKCEQAGANLNVARLLWNDYVFSPQSVGDLKVFADYQTKSPLLLKKKLSMHRELKLTLTECEKIIGRIDLPLSPLEYRLLGQAQYNDGRHTDAANNLKCALVGGDLEAGDFLYSHFKEGLLYFLADNGVAEAAYELGKDSYSRALAGGSGVMNKAMKYLHIAAAQKHPQALELLGDIWFEKKISDKSKQKDALKTALQYYLRSQEGKKLKKQMLERIGLIYYNLEDYSEAKRYLEKADTAQANFLLGQMHEEGHGQAADQQKALKYYEAASDKGHAQAQVEYSRLSAKIEKEKEKTYISSNTSYYSSSYYSGYYTSYYSGW